MKLKWENEPENLNPEDATVSAFSAIGIMLIILLLAMTVAYLIHNGYLF